MLRIWLEFRFVCVCHGLLTPVNSHDSLFALVCVCVGIKSTRLQRVKFNSVQFNSIYTAVSVSFSSMQPKRHEFASPTANELICVLGCATIFGFSSFHFIWITRKKEQSKRREIGINFQWFASNHYQIQDQNECTHYKNRR